MPRLGRMTTGQWGKMRLSVERNSHRVLGCNFPWRRLLGRRQNGVHNLSIPSIGHG